jgi:hypothetical protein
MALSSDFNRTLSGIFTNPTFKSLLKSGDNDYFIKKIKKYNSLLSVSPNNTVKDAIKEAYIYLSRNYRNEYIYKNTIANKILLGKHNLNTATLISEYKVGNSIADLLLLNGTSTVYEIKTELDSPDKLKKQIEDYKKAFCKIYLVTHHSLVTRYLQMIEYENIGLISLSGRFQLSTIKEAQQNEEFLEIETMMRCLRKSEYSSIIKKYYGCLPNISNIHFFSTCLEMAKKISPKNFHDLMTAELKKRSPNEKEFLNSINLPAELKHICLCINPTKQEYNNLLNFLNQNL